MITLTNIINRETEKLGLLFMILLNDTFSEEGQKFFIDLMTGFDSNKLSTEDVYNLYSKTTDINVTINKASQEEIIWLSCDFRGHAGYPGGEYSKNLLNIDILIKNDVLLYLLAINGYKIEKFKKEIQDQEDN